MTESLLSLRKVLGSVPSTSKKQTNKTPDCLGLARRLSEVACCKPDTWNQSLEPQWWKGRTNSWMLSNPTSVLWHVGTLPTNMWKHFFKMCGQWNKWEDICNNVEMLPQSPRINDYRAGWKTREWMDKGWLGILTKPWSCHPFFDKTLAHLHLQVTSSVRGTCEIPPSPARSQRGETSLFKAHSKAVRSFISHFQYWWLNAGTLLLSYIPVPFFGRRHSLF